MYVVRYHFYKKIGGFLSCHVRVMFNLSNLVVCKGICGALNTMHTTKFKVSLLKYVNSAGLELERPNNSSND